MTLEELKRRLQAYEATRTGDDPDEFQVRYYEASDAALDALPDLIAAVEALSVAVNDDGFVTEARRRESAAILSRLGVE